MIQEKVTKNQLVYFGIIMGFGIPIFIGFFIPHLNNHDFQKWTLWLGFTFLIIGILRPKMLLGTYTLWMNIGKVLGWINSRVILGLVFMFVLLPISIVMKIFGYDPLKNTINKNKKTYKEFTNSRIIDLRRIF